MPSYTAGDRQHAYEIYREVRSIEKASDFLGIPVVTLQRWKKQDGWETKDLEERKNELSLDGASIRAFKLAKKFGLSLQDAEVFRQVKKVETICFAVIENKEDIVNRLKLKPETFDQAMKALKICWDTRQRIFEPQKPSQGQGDGKVNYIAELNQFFGDKSAAVTVEAKKVVPGRLPHIERSGDNGS